MWNSVISIWKRWINPIWTDRVWGGVILAAILALIAAIYGHLSGSTAHLFAWLGDTVTISRWQLPAEFAGGHCWFSLECSCGKDEYDGRLSRNSRP
jgi:hypothetical protein